MVKFRNSSTTHTHKQAKDRESTGQQVENLIFEIHNEYLLQFGQIQFCCISASRQQINSSSAQVSRQRCNDGAAHTFCVCVLYPYVAE